MPKDELIKPDQRVSVASMVDYLNSLDYYAGKLNELPRLHSYNTLSLDHPAQRPRRDSPIPFRGRPRFNRLASYPRLDTHQSAGEARTHSSSDESEEEEVGNANTQALKLHGSTLGRSLGSTQQQAESEQQSPFRRQNSGRCLLPASSSAYSPRESVSHAAFERVRTMSTSLPPIAMPNPRVDVQPFVESMEAYITRKLNERWPSPPTASTGQNQRHGHMAVHVEAPFVQAVLENIDQMLAEHTKSLREVIEESKRLFHDKEIDCYLADTESDCESLLTNSDVEEMMESEGYDGTQTTGYQNSRVLAVVDETAEHLDIDHSAAGPRPQVLPLPPQAVLQLSQHVVGNHSLKSTTQHHDRDVWRLSLPASKPDYGQPNPYVVSTHPDSHPHQ